MDMTWNSCKRRSVAHGCDVFECEQGGKMGVSCCNERPLTITSAEVCSSPSNSFPFIVVVVLSDGSRVPISQFMNEKVMRGTVECINNGFKLDMLQASIYTFKAGTCFLNGSPQLQTCPKRNTAGMCTCDNVSNCFTDGVIAYNAACLISRQSNGEGVP